MVRITLAILYSVWKHRGQKRKITGYPYVVHPLRVGYALWRQKQPLEVVLAGILHDTLEDTNATDKELLRLFGAEVLHLVSFVSKNRPLYIPTSRAEIMPKKVLAIKLADVKDNLRDNYKHGQAVSDAVLVRYNEFVQKAETLLNNQK